jgi:hypothetical protein
MKDRFPLSPPFENIIVSPSITALLMWMALATTGCSTLDAWINPPAPGANGFVRIENTPESEVRAAFVHVVRVAQNRDVEAFKKLIEPSALPLFEDSEWSHPGHYVAYMAAIAADKPKDYHLDLTPSLAVFRIEPKQRLGDYSKTQTTEVILVREGPQWKIGAPSKPPAEETLESPKVKKGPPTKASRKKFVKVPLE